MEENQKISQQSDTGLDPGHTLSQGRLEAKLTTDQVAAKLHISSRKVAALESNDFSELPEATYVRGYMKNYANLVGLDPAPILAAYNSIIGKDKKAEELAMASAAVHPAGNIINDNTNLIKIASMFIVAVVVVALIVVMQDSDEPAPAAVHNEFSAWENTGSDSTTDNQFPESGDFPVAADENTSEPGMTSEQPADINGTTATQQAAVLPVPKTSSGSDSNVFARNDPVEDVKTEAVAETPVAQAGLAVNQPAKVATDQVNKSKIVLYVEEDSWADIRDSQNNKLLYETVRSGRMVTLEGVPPFKVFLGNVGGVKLFYNGTEYNTAQHRRGLVARFRLDKPAQ